MRSKGLILLLLVFTSCNNRNKQAYSGYWCNIKAYTYAKSEIGKNDELMNQIFALKKDGILERNDASGYYLITKTSEIPFTQATFENSKERVRLELAHEYADKELEIL